MDSELDEKRWFEMPVTEAFGEDDTVAHAIGVEVEHLMDQLPADVKAWLRLPAVEGLAWMKVGEVYDLVRPNRLEGLLRGAAEYARRRSRA